MLLEKYIREILSSELLLERNYPQFFKKPFDYEMQMLSPDRFN